MQPTRTIDIPSGVPARVVQGPWGGRLGVRPDGAVYPTLARSATAPAHEAVAVTLPEAARPQVAKAVSPARPAEPQRVDGVSPGNHRVDSLAQAPLSAGMVDDNADFGAFVAFLKRHPGEVRRSIAIDKRVRVSVQDASGRPVPDARLSVSNATGQALPVWARTDAAGQAWLMAPADAPTLEDETSVWTVTATVSGNGNRISQTVAWRPGQRDALQIPLPTRATARPRLDVAFVIDATGSMGDEIDKLKRSMRAVADAVSALPGQPQVCYALVAYRDRHDDFFVQATDFTHDLATFQQSLGALQAAGGGDEPEALNEAMHTAIHRLSWRGEGTARVLVLLADAPPHEDYGAPHADHNALAAAAKGIKVTGIAASGMNRTGEIVMRQTSQYTGGRFVFLTYDDVDNPGRGPGRHTRHDVSNYSVQTLDKLVVRLLTEEMSAWPR